MFEAAEECGLQIELDRACRDRAISAFRAISGERQDILLFINLYSSILDTTTGSNHLIKTIRHYGLNPQSVVIEIDESRVRDGAQLKRFVDTYRSYGFLIALDDVGRGFSNMDRISLVKPDIVKTDISLVQNICGDYHVQEVFRALVGLSTRIGALVVAEGIETEEAALRALELGAGMIQGYYISRPRQMDAVPPDFLRREIDAVAARFQEAERKKLTRDRQRYGRLNVLTRQGVDRLCLMPVEDFDAELLRVANGHADIECAYVLDSGGMQTGGTVFSRAVSGIKNNACSARRSRGPTTP
jgi:EAL domain-containing protein (putative c-di-GMP-specific phosphodiesterase class I)